MGKALHRQREHAYVLLVISDDGLVVKARQNSLLITAAGFEFENFFSAEFEGTTRGLYIWVRVFLLLSGWLSDKKSFALCTLASIFYVLEVQTLEEN